MVVLNLDPLTPATFTPGVQGENADVWVLTAKALDASTVELNGDELRAGDDGSLPPLLPRRRGASELVLAPLSIAFLRFPDASAPACR